MAKQSSWWQKNEEKGRPIAVATPVPTAPTAAAVNVAAGGASTPSYYVPAPNGNNHVPHNQMQQMMQMQHHTTIGQTLEGSMGQRTSTHKMFLMFQVIAGFTGINNLVAQVIAMTYPGDIAMEIVCRCYLIGFFALATLNEMERMPMLRESPILSNFVGRGVFYSFLGVLGQNLYDVGYDNHYRRNSNYSGSSSSSSSYRSGDYNGYYGPRMPSTEDFAEWYIWMTSFLMFNVGIIYMIMGALCLQQKLHRLQEQYQQSQFQAAQQRNGVVASSGGGCGPFWP